MIRVQRGQPPIETDIWSLADDARRRIREYYALTPAEMNQRTPDLGDSTGRFYNRIRPILEEAFSQKCAYCESRIGISWSGVVDQFRPRVGATDLAGVGSLPHYGWLCLEWDNLFPACELCNRSKKNLFPVEGQVRAPPLTPIEVIDSTERALLINPCSEDPEEHLEFTDDGQVLPKSSKGEITIKVLSLNRPALVEARAKRHSILASVFAVLIDSQLGPTRQPLIARLSAELRPDTEYTAVARAFVARRRSELQALGFFDQADAPVTAIADAASPSGIASGYAATGETSEESFRLEARPLKSIRIRNFRMLRDLTLELPEPRSGEPSPWLVLLGENATGKSTVLLAVALALAGAKAAARHIKPRDVLHRRAAGGEVRLEFWDREQPAILGFSRSEPHFTGTEMPTALVLAYGALRVPGRRQGSLSTSISLAPLTLEAGSPETRPTHIAGITREVARLPNPHPWLRSLPEKHFDAVARVLKTVLLQDQAAQMTRSGRYVRFQVHGDSPTLNELSAGYRAIVGIICDILQVLFSRWDTPESAEGFVLLDELESHLHPRWKMRIAGALRIAFPQVQFIITTHDPLVLRGVRNGEVRLMLRDRELGAVPANLLPDVEGLRVDQLLQSEAFGLHSTLDPQIEADFQLYYELLARDHLSSEQQGTLDAVKERLAGKSQFGSNRRERLMLEAIDSYLAGTAQVTTPARPDPALIGRLQSVWDRA